jgi:hypothetical protein
MTAMAAPDGVVLEVAVRAADSPSQERLGRIAAMLREAEMAGHPSARSREGRRNPAPRRTRPAA